MKKVLKPGKILVAIFTAALLLLFVSATKIPKASLEIKIMNCRDDEKNSLENLELVKKGKTVKKITGWFSDQVFNDLDTGTYYLKYKTLFKKNEQVKIILSEFKSYPVNLCVDYLDYSKETYVPVADLLKENENYQIIMMTLGCVYGNDTLTIYRKADSYIATYGAATFGYKTKTLALADIAKIRQFELELNYIGVRRPQATVWDQYVISYNGEQKTFIEGNGKWKGGNYLITQLSLNLKR